MLLQQKSRQKAWEFLVLHSVMPLNMRTSFQVHCNSSIWLEQGRSNLLKSWQTRRKRAMSCHRRELLGGNGGMPPEFCF